MYASIDLHNFKVLHVHPVQEVVWDLVYLECGNVPWLTVENTDAPNFLLKYGPFELRKLYSGLTGGDLPNHTIEVMREALALVIGALPAKKVNPIELIAQCEAAEADIESGATGFQYVERSKKPAQQQVLFEHKALPLEEWKLTQAPQLAQQRKVAAAEAAARIAENTAPVPGAAGPRASRGGVRPLIWSTADTMWNAAGKPTDKTIVLALRKEMMRALENDGIGRNTSSNELGAWMKDRVG